MEKGGRSVVVGKKHWSQQWFKTWPRHGGNILAAINRSLPKVVVVSKPQESVEMLGGHVVLQMNAFSVLPSVSPHRNEKYGRKSIESWKVSCAYLSLSILHTYLELDTMHCYHPHPPPQHSFCCLSLHILQPQRPSAAWRPGTCYVQVDGRLCCEAWNVCTGHVAGTATWCCTHGGPILGP